MTNFQLGDSAENRLQMVQLTGDIWRPDMTRKTGPTETHSLPDPDLRQLMRDYEARHGRCGSFDIKVIK